MFNDKALTGGIRTITIKVSSGKKWELRTSKTPFDTSANPYPTTGTSHGEKTATSDGITWTVDTADEYFALCYKDSGAVYVDSVEMTYGSIQEVGDNFQKAVDAIADATTTKEKQAAIDNAMQEYDKLSPADQAKMHDSYLKLQEYIDDLSGGDSDGGKVKPYVWAILGIIGGAALVFAICYARSRRRKA